MNLKENGAISGTYDLPDATDKEHPRSPVYSRLAHNHACHDVDQLGCLAHHLGKLGCLAHHRNHAY